MDTVRTVANRALDMLQGLAQKLGVTLEYLWPRYAKYVTAQAVADAVTWGLALVAATISVYWIGRWIRHDVKNDCEPEAAAFFALLGGIAFIFAFVNFLSHISTGIAACLAPEGYALTQILSKLK